MEDKLLTLEQVSKYLNIHKMTVYRLAQKRLIPASKIGRVWRFRRHRIDKWLDKQENNKSGSRTTEKSRR